MTQSFPKSNHNELTLAPVWARPSSCSNLDCFCAGAPCSSTGAWAPWEMGYQWWPEVFLPERSVRLTDHREQWAKHGGMRDITTTMNDGLAFSYLPDAGLHLLISNNLSLSLGCFQGRWHGVYKGTVYNTILIIPCKGPFCALCPRALARQVRPPASSWGGTTPG